MGDDGRRRRVLRQQRLKETFLDLGNAFVRVRMTFLRLTGMQPPDGSQRPRRPRGRS